MTASCLLLTILAQATTFTILAVILHHFFEIFPCFHYQTVLIRDAKAIYYIGTAIRANGDLPFRFLSPRTGGTEGGVKTIEGSFSKDCLRIRLKINL